MVPLGPRWQCSGFVLVGVFGIVALVGFASSSAGFDKTNPLQYCTSTANESNASDPRPFIQIAGTLCCGHYCGGPTTHKGQTPSVDYMLAYQAFTDYVNTNDTVKGINVSGVLHRVNITICDDRGEKGLTSELPDIPERIYAAFVCNATLDENDQPQPLPRGASLPPGGVDFLLSPQGSEITDRVVRSLLGADDLLTKTKELMQKTCLGNNTAPSQWPSPDFPLPILIAAGASEGGFNVTEPNSGISYPMAGPWPPAETIGLTTLKSVSKAIQTARQKPETAGCGQGEANDAHPDIVMLYTDDIWPRRLHDGISKNLPISHYDDGRLGQRSFKGTCDGDKPRDDYCSPDSEACGFWGLGYDHDFDHGGPVEYCSTILTSSYKRMQVVYDYKLESISEHSEISYRLEGQLEKVAAHCTAWCDPKTGDPDDPKTKSDACERCQLQVVLGLGHTEQFEQFVGAVTRIYDESPESLPKAALFVDGMELTDKMLKDTDHSQFKYKGWIGSSPWHPDVATGNTSWRYMGNSAQFSQLMLAAATRYPNLNSPELHRKRAITTYHASAAAGLTMLQKALETESSVRNKSDAHGILRALKNLDYDSFWGRINISENGQNPAKADSVAVLQWQDWIEGDEPLRLVGPPDLIKKSCDLNTGCHTHQLQFPLECLYQPEPEPEPTQDDRFIKDAENDIEKHWRPALLLGAGLLLSLWGCTCCVKKRARRHGARLAKARGVGADLRVSILGASFQMEEELPNRPRIVEQWGAHSVSPARRMFTDSDLKDLRIVRQLGEGAFGVVEEGEWKCNGVCSRVAVKALKLDDGFERDAPEKKKKIAREVLEDFRKEVESLSNLNHPNLTAFIGFTTKDPKKKNVLRMSIVLEFVGGGALDTWLYKKHWKPTERQCLKMASDVAAGMAYLHGRPIPMLHRDLKSPNLLLVEPPVVQQGHDVDFVPCLKITDFGMAREKEMQLAETIRTLKQAQTQLMTGCGTLYWMSPELLEGKKYNESVDVYAFAICLLEMGSGEVPRFFDGVAVAPALVGAHVVNGKRPDWSELGINLQRAATPGVRVLRSIIEECWSHAPESRPSFTSLYSQICHAEASLAGMSPKLSSQASIYDEEDEERVAPRLAVENESIYDET